MTKNKRSKQKAEEFVKEPWIKGQTGLIIIGVLGLAVAIFTGIVVYPLQGLGSAVLWGLGSAVGLWVIFGGVYLLNRILRG